MVASVIIPSYNGAHVIGDTLAALLGQETDFDFEVIVADSSSDETPELIRERFPQVTFIRFEQQTPAPQARNAAIRRAQGEIIGMIDQDCLADPGWLQGMVEAHRAHPEVAAVAGGIRPANPARLWGLANFYLEFREFNHIRPPGMTDNWITCNVSLKRRVFEQYGYFPEDLWPGDDVILAQTMRAAGEKALFAPQLSIAHVNRGELRRILPHARMLGWASAQVRRRLPSVPDAWMARMPLSAWAVPVARPLRVLGCFARWRPAAALKALPLASAMSLICLWWATGFWEGARERVGDAAEPAELEQ